MRQMLATISKSVPHKSVTILILGVIKFKSCRALSET